MKFTRISIHGKQTIVIRPLFAATLSEQIRLAWANSEGGDEKASRLSPCNHAKSSSSLTSFSVIVARSFSLFLSFARSLALSLSLSLSLYLSLARSLSIYLSLACSLSIYLSLVRSFYLSIFRSLARSLARSLSFSLSLVRSLSLCHYIYDPNIVLFVRGSRSRGNGSFKRMFGGKFEKSTREK